jgi:hypothetical protein
MANKDKLKVAGRGKGKGADHDLADSLLALATRAVPERERANILDTERDRLGHILQKKGWTNQVGRLYIAVHLAFDIVGKAMRERVGLEPVVRPPAVAALRAAVAMSGGIAFIANLLSLYNEHLSVGLLLLLAVVEALIGFFGAYL